MNTFSQRLVCLIGLALCSKMSIAFGADDVNTCYWVSGSGPVTFTPDVGAVYIPRDAPLGSVIGIVNDLFPQNPERGYIGCSNDGSVLLSFNAIASAPIFMGSLPPTPGTILHSNIPGVGSELNCNDPWLKSFQKTTHSQPSMALSCQWTANTQA